METLLRYLGQSYLAWIYLLGYLRPILADSMPSRSLHAPESGFFAPNMLGLLAQIARMFRCLSLLGTMASLSPCLHFRVKLSLLARDHRDLLL